LRANSIGLVSAATLGVVFISPALGFYGNWGPVAVTTGVAPFVFVIAAIIVLPTALSYAMVARRLPSAGSAFTWVGHSMGKDVGNWLGWMMLPYYVLLIGAPAALFGLFFNALLADLGLDVSLTNLPTYLIGLAIVYSLSTFFAYRGIETSVRTAVIVVAFEIAIVLALSVTILFKHHSQVSMTPLNPSSGSLNWTTFFIALPICFFSFLGMDAVSTAAEETKLARRTIPRATLLAVAIITVYLVFNAWAFSFAISDTRLNEYLSTGITPVTPIAKDFWGGADILVTFTGLTAGMGACMAITVAASRIMFSMGQRGALPSALGKLDRKYSSPVWGIMVVLIVGVLFDVIAGAWIGPLYAYFWSGTAVVFFALVTYVFVNVGNFLIHYRDRDNGFRIVSNVIVPACGAVFSAVLIYKGFLEGLWEAGWITIGRGILLFCLLWTLAGFVYAYLVRDTTTDPSNDGLADPLADPGRAVSGTA
jgi:amino acid transporter